MRAASRQKSGIHTNFGKISGFNRSTKVVENIDIFARGMVNYFDK
jgi:hypothetical protein